MDAKGLTPGARVRVEAGGDTDAVSLSVGEDGAPLTVRRELARRIYVVPDEG